MSLNSLGQFVYDTAANDSYLRVTIAVQFESERKGSNYYFEVWQDKRLLEQEAKSFTTALAIGLIIIALVLSLLMGALMYWLLKPLQTVTEELEEMEKGEQSEISEDYPQELAKLTQALNTVVSVERKQRERYRNSLGDLAHSLKTPLAVMRGELQGNGSETIQGQLTRMDEVITYQLKRASSGGSRVWVKPVKISTVLQRLMDAMQKVYGDKGIQLDKDVPANIGFLGDEADLMEMAGNLVENAFKYTNTWVSVTALLSGEHIQIAISDDGPGIPEEQWESVQQRGIRLDSRPIGQGIGLAVVADLVASYDGEMRLQPSQVGTSILLSLPGRSVLED